jgi:hypothetical protein
LERLDDKTAKFVNAAVETLTVIQTNRNLKIYQIFLHNILRYYGRGLVFLCAVSLDKQKIIIMTGPDKISLMNFIKDNKTLLLFPILDSLATNYHIPHENNTLHITLIYAEANFVGRSGACLSDRTVKKTYT